MALPTTFFTRHCCVLHTATLCYCYKSSPWITDCYSALQSSILHHEVIHCATLHSYSALHIGFSVLHNIPPLLLCPRAKPYSPATKHHCTTQLLPWTLLCKKLMYILWPWFMTAARSLPGLPSLTACTLCKKINCCRFLPNRRVTLEAKGRGRKASRAGTTKKT